MSHPLINRSPDLKRLRDEGFDVEVRGGFLLVKNIPYVNSARQIARGALVSKLTLAGDRTAQPGDHVAYFAGDYPCNPDGSEIAQIKHGSVETTLEAGLTVHHSFSAKPTSGFYNDYYDKMSTYAAILAGRAQQLDPSVRMTTNRIDAATQETSPFHYIDTASSRAEISAISQKLATGKIAIVGLGGTGSYVLDLVSKTPVQEIHLFDGDRLLQHNAFRSPGAPSTKELEDTPYKVDYFAQIYSRMHRGVFTHPVFVNENNLDLFEGITFAFLCLDRGVAKMALVAKLEALGVAFVDVGMGLFTTEQALGGIVRVTTSTPDQRDHVRQKNRIPFADATEGGNVYERNIQIADLNALNAALAVIKWKKLCGFYIDLGCEHFTTYTIDGNLIINEDRS